MSKQSRRNYSNKMVRKHDNITKNLENRIKGNFDSTYTNREYGTWSVVGEIDLEARKKVYRNGRIENWVYIFETKCTDTQKAEAKAYNQTHRALDRYEGCRNADRVFLYYVTKSFVRNIGVYENKL